MTQTARLTASDGQPGDYFGFSIDLSGDTLAVGAPNDQIDADAYHGSAYVFVKPAGDWITSTQTAKLTVSDFDTVGQFGWSVALSGDKLVAGAPPSTVGANESQGSAYAFVEPAGGWVDMSEHHRINALDGAAHDNFAWSLDVFGDTLIVGAYLHDIDANQNQGSLYVFRFVALPFQYYLPWIVR